MKIFKSFPPHDRRRFAGLAITILSFAMLQGCALSGAGPFKGSIETDAEATVPYTVVDLSASTIAPYMRARDVAPVSHIADREVKDFRIVPGDVIKVMIADNAVEGGVFAPLSAGGTVFENVRVGADGRISLPYVGRPNLKGLTLFQVEEALSKSLAGVAIAPLVHVEMVGDMSGSVLVAGAVKTPGRFSALKGPLTLLDAINMAGGPILEPHLTNVVLRTGTSVTTLNYQQALSGSNTAIPPGSEIVLERARKRFVAMGAVGDPGLHDLPSENPSLLEVLGVVKGLREQSADPRGVFVFRLGDEDKTGARVAEVFRLDMRQPASIFLARQFLIQPEDAVYVTNAAIYEWQKIISPIVQVLVLGRTLESL